MKNKSEDGLKAAVSKMDFKDITGKTGFYTGWRTCLEWIESQQQENCQGAEEFYKERYDVDTPNGMGIAMIKFAEEYPSSQFTAIPHGILTNPKEIKEGER